MYYYGRVLAEKKVLEMVVNMPYHQVCQHVHVIERLCYCCYICYTYMLYIYVIHICYTYCLN